MITQNYHSSVDSQCTVAFSAVKESPQIMYPKHLIMHFIQIQL